MSLVVSVMSMAVRIKHLSIASVLQSTWKYLVLFQVHTEAEMHSKPHCRINVEKNMWATQILW